MTLFMAVTCGFMYYGCGGGCTFRVRSSPVGEGTAPTRSRPAVSHVHRRRAPRFWEIGGYHTCHLQIGALFAMKDTSWDHALEVTAGGSGLVGHAGGMLLRKLADQCGLTAALEAALTQRGTFPQLSRGMVLVSTAIAIALGATAIADVAVLGQLAPVLGAAPSPSTARRVLALASDQVLARTAQARARIRARVWTLIGEAGGFPWLEIAGKTLTGWLFIDMDGTLITAHSPVLGTRSLVMNVPAGWFVAVSRRVASLKVMLLSVR